MSPAAKSMHTEEKLAYIKGTLKKIASGLTSDSEPQGIAQRRERMPVCLGSLMIKLSSSVLLHRLC